MPIAVPMSRLCCWRVTGNAIYSSDQADIVNLAQADIQVDVIPV